jgi:hypothetical protein
MNAECGAGDRLISILACPRAGETASLTERRNILSPWYLVTALYFLGLVGFVLLTGTDKRWHQWLRVIVWPAAVAVVMIQLSVEEIEMLGKKVS